MNFKVGQKVWDSYNKCFVTIVDIKISEINIPYSWEIKDDNGIICIVNLSQIKYLHQTADDMFEELGYERDNKEMPYIVFEKSMLSGRTMRIIFYPADKSYRANLQVLPKEHLAIHQKMIELGWVE